MLFNNLKIRNKCVRYSCSLLLKTFVLLHLVCFAPCFVQAQQTDTLSVLSAEITPKSEIPELQDSLFQIKQDSAKAAFKDSLRKSSDLKSRVKYHARDSIIFDITGKHLYLYGEVSLEYEDITLKAEKVKIDWTTTTMYAEGIQDTTGQYIGQPQFDEGGQIYNAEAITFNFNTRKGRILGGRTQQDENFVIGDTIKRNPDNSYFIRSGKITTCNAADPHFYIYSNKMKIIPNDKVITGRVNMFVEKVPVPLVLPFGFFPNKKGKKSGILMPSYGNDGTRGYFLRDGGYYIGMSEYADLTLRGDIFSYGSWRLNAASKYNWKYHFNGGLDVRYAVSNTGDRTNLDFKESEDFFVVWKHEQKLGNTARLSSDVNAGTSTYLGLNSMNVQDITTSQLMSNVSYSKTFANTPWSLNAKLGHQQNTQTKIVSLELPSIGLNRGRTFPFKRKTGGGKERWYEKIGYAYSSQAVNRITAPDSVIFKPQAKSMYENGIKHSIPVSMNFKALKYMNITPSLNYNEYWYFKHKMNRWQNGFFSKDSAQNDIWNPGRVVNDTLNQLLTGRDFSASVTATTRIYGMFKLPGSRSRIVRHTLTPNIGYSYRPDFASEKWGYYYKVQSDSANTESQYLTKSKFEGTVFGGPGAGEQQLINFGMINLFELKYKSFQKGQDTLLTKPETKKLTLIDNLGINGNYNLAADSFNLSTISFSVRTILLNNLLNINLNGIMDPYYQNAVGKRENVFRWAEDKKPGYITTSNLAISTSFRSKKEKARPKEKNPDPDVLAEINRNRELYADFNIPWSLNLSYNLLYSKPNKTLKSTLNQSVQVSGDLNLTEKWKIRLTTGYDFVAKDMTLTEVNIIRDLHCWEASFNWIPFGTRKYFMLTINAKSSTLQDLKLTKQSPPNYRNLLN